MSRRCDFVTGDPDRERSYGVGDLGERVFVGATAALEHVEAVVGGVDHVERRVVAQGITHLLDQVQAREAVAGSLQE